MMEFEERLKDFVAQTVPFGSLELTSLLIGAEWERLRDECGMASPAVYNTVNAFYKSGNYTVPAEAVNPVCCGEPIFLENYPIGYLAGFYREHGLEPVHHGWVSTLSAVCKLEMALKSLSYVPNACREVTALVRRIQLLHSGNEEVDVSYSHPDIPFSIFISLCGQNSGVADLRVAESMLHEAMHLKLTLIEKHLPLVVRGSAATYFSPWRGEERPVRGVLHGMFVFRAVYDYLDSVKPILNEEGCLDHILGRQADILGEFRALALFPQAAGLTECGASLAANLWPLS